MKTRTNAEWLSELKANGETQTAALADLRDYLLRAALYTFSRNRDAASHLGRAEIEQSAEDVTQNALIAVLAHLDDFRGDSQFTTWVYKFAVNIALVTARREQWKRVSLDQMLADPAFEGLPISKDDAAPDPDVETRRVEVWAEMRAVIEQELTERQRQVLKAIVFADVSLDQVAEHFGSNRNAMYKLLHDARRKLKERLETRGFTVEEILNLFAARG